MKSRFLSLLLSLCLFSIISFAQKNNFEVEASLDNQIISRQSKKTSVKVKITNLAVKDFAAKDLKYISFYLLKWGTSDFYIAGKDIHKISKKLKSKILKQTESVEFQVSLNEFKWHDRLEDSKKNGEKFAKLAPATYWFYAVIDVSDKKIDRETPAEESYGSNTLAVKLISK